MELQRGFSCFFCNFVVGVAVFVYVFVLLCCCFVVAAVVAVAFVVATVFAVAASTKRKPQTDACVCTRTIIFVVGIIPKRFLCLNEGLKINFQY